MNETTKAKINLSEGTIELEGNEAFVSKYLDEFKETISAKPPVADPKRTPHKPSTKKDRPKKRNTSSSKIKIPKKIEIEKFDIGGNEDSKLPSLKDFFNSKNPGTSNAKRILVIGYYVTEVLKKDEFSEGNIEYGFKALSLTKKPAHLRQIIINQKNEKGWFEESGDNNSWKITKIGELFVDEDLPESKEK